MGFSDFIFSNAFIIMFLPIWVAFLITLNSTIPSFKSKHFTINLTLISTGICALYSICLLYITSSTGLIINNDIINWLSLNDSYLSFGFLLDNLSAISLVTVNIITFFIQLYSYEHLKNEPDFQRYFVYINIFNFALSGLIISTNLIQSFMFLILTSIMAYLLYGFWYKKKLTSEYSRRFFITNIIADCFLFLGMFMLLYFKLNYFPDAKEYLLNYSSLYDLCQGIISYSTETGFTIICLTLITGLSVKSFSFTLLPNSKNTVEAPGTSFAIVNSIACFIPGIYLTIRLLPIFNISLSAIKTLLWIGVVLSLICSLLAISQKYIRKIISYGICAQTGLIFASLGILSVSESVFHTINIISASALLILTSDIIIYLFNNSDDIRYMGGVREKHPILAVIWGFSALSFMGIFFSGAFSKIQILDEFLNKGLIAEYTILLLSIILISFAFAKTYFAIFEGERHYNIEDLKETNTYFQTKTSLSCLLLIIIFSGLFTYNLYGNLFNINIKNDISLKGVIFFFIINIIFVIIAFILNKKNITLTKKLPVLRISVTSLYKNICSFLYLIERIIIECIIKLVSLIIKGFSYIMTKHHDLSIQSQILLSFTGIILALIFALFYYYKLKGF